MFYSENSEYKSKKKTANLLNGLPLLALETSTLNRPVFRS